MSLRQGRRVDRQRALPPIEPRRVCFRSRSLKITRPNFTKFSEHVTCGRGSVLLWRQCNTLCATSGFVDDVMFSHNGTVGPYCSSNRVDIFTERTRTFIHVCIGPISYCARLQESSAPVPNCLGAEVSWVRSVCQLFSLLAVTPLRFHYRLETYLTSHKSFPTVDSTFLPSGLTPLNIIWTVSSQLCRFLLLVLFVIFFYFDSVPQIVLATDNFWMHAGRLRPGFFNTVGGHVVYWAAKRIYWSHVLGAGSFMLGGGLAVAFGRLAPPLILAPGCM